MSVEHADKKPAATAATAACHVNAAWLKSTSPSIKAVVANDRASFYRLKIISH